MTFGKRLRVLRLKNGLTQLDIAKLLGVTVQRASSYENGREPCFDFICKLARYFDTTADYLIGYSDAPKEPRANDKITIESEFFDFCSGCNEIEPRLKTSKLFSGGVICLCDIEVTCVNYWKCQRLAAHIKEDKL